MSNPTDCLYALVSYHLPYDTSSFDANLSWTMHFGELYREIQIMLKGGHFVSVLDYKRPRASYGANILAVHSY